MTSRRRPLHRSVGERRYRCIHVIAVEGTKTEPQYFALLGDLLPDVHIECLKNRRGRSPASLLQRITRRLNTRHLERSDAAWIVVDRDSWKEEHLAMLHEWSLRDHRHGLVLSNPSFEYWLLLHFEDGHGVIDAHACTSRLRRHIPDYDKSIDRRRFTLPRIENAVRRARLRDNPPCVDWPRHPGSTTVYRLVARLIEAAAA